MHFPTHVRDAFARWADDEFPEVAIVQVDDEDREVPVREFLASYTGCSDIMPRELCEQVAAGLDYPNDVRGMTYGHAAHALLLARDASTEEAHAYIDLLFGDSRNSYESPFQKPVPTTASAAAVNLVPPVNVQVTEEDMAAVRARGGTGAQVIEHAINRDLDKKGVPREHRVVQVAGETITIELPPGYDFADR